MGSIPTRSRHPGLLTVALLLLSGAVTAPAAVRAQEEPPADTTATEGPAAVPGPGAALDTTPAPPVSPLGAFARSLVLPGWGQAEVDKPVRGAIYFAAEAASLWMVFKTQTKLSAARRGSTADSTSLVESRTSQREDWIVLSVFFALMSGIDAWVSAHLYGFEGQLEPPSDGTPGAQVSYRIPLELP